MSKIGEDVRAKQEEKGPYTSLGIVKLAEGGYAVVRLKISGTEVLTRTITRKAENLAMALQEFQIETGTYGMKYLDKEMK